MSDTLHEITKALEGRYTVESELGAGGMATVLRARDIRHGRSVAIKVLRAELTGQGGVERFLLEIGVTARLNHPHILPLLDSGEVAGLPFYVMPLVDGESLRARLDRHRPLAVDEALRFAAHVADALAYAHAQGVLHRDIKPDNIMISGRHALVADFGIAKAIRLVMSDPQLTVVGSIVGTPAYMSPEQSVGEDSLDGRSDVYSLGAVLFEMLAGVTPFAGSTAQAIIVQRFTTEAPSLRAMRAEISPIAEAIVTRSLARDPGARFSSAAEFADALSHVPGGVPPTRTTTPTPTPAVEAPIAPSLAILPFNNPSADPENEFLSDGITEEILSSLSRMRTIRVCARSTSFAFKGQTTDAREIGARLGVRAVLTGSVRRAGSRIRVNAELVNASDGFQLWADRYDRTVEDVFAIEDEIAGAIVGALSETLAPAPKSAATTPTISAAAHELVLRGRHLLARRTAVAVRQAADCFEQAIAAEPRYAVAHAGLADALALLGVYGAVAPGASMPPAKAAAERALALEPELAEARTTLGLVLAAYDWRWRDAEETLAAARQSDPGYPTAYQWLATNVLAPQHRTDEALDAVSHAMRLDPLAIAVRVALSSVLFYARRYGEAIDAAQAALAIEPAFPLAHFFIGQAHSELGNHAEALAACLRATELSGESTESLALLGYASARAGDTVSATDILSRLSARSSGGYVAPSHRALVHVGLGEHDRSLDSLEDAVRVRATDLMWLAVRPAWDPVRATERFTQLLRQTHLAPP